MIGKILSKRRNFIFREIESMPKPRSTVFVGSSSEGFDYAKAIQLNLDRDEDCEVLLWPQGIFELGKGSLQSLAEQLYRFDFAVLLLTPDDLLTSRDETSPCPRDNVLLELGMFIGKIGPERTFAVVERSSKTKIPSDLAGVTMASFQLPENGNAQSALGSACTQIGDRIRELGIRPPALIDGQIDMETSFQIIHNLLDDSVKQFLILMHEKSILIPRSAYEWGPAYIYMMANGPGGHGSFSIDRVCERLPDANLLKQDLRNNVSLTPHGSAFAKWLIANGYKASFFDSEIGGWGEAPSGYKGLEMFDWQKRPQTAP